MSEKKTVTVVLCADHSCKVGDRPMYRTFRYNWFFKQFGANGFGVYQIQSGFNKDNVIESTKNRLHGQIKVLEIMEL